MTSQRQCVVDPRESVKFPGWKRNSEPGGWRYRAFTWCRPGVRGVSGIANREISFHFKTVDFTPANTGSVVAFVVIVALVVAAIPAAAFFAYRTAPGGGRRMTILTSAGVLAWIVLVCAYVGSGVMARLPFQGLHSFFAAVFFVGIAAGISPLAGRIAANVPLVALVGFHAFRVPLELVLHSWAGQGTIPQTMTWDGQNWDIISGALAIIVAPFAIRSRALAWGVNIIGSVLLLNVIRVAALSSPLPIGWGQDPPLLLALHLPYALIAPVCVAAALAGHIVLTRALLRPKQTTATSD